MRSEEGPQQLSRFRGADTGHDLGTVVEPPIAHDIPQRSHSSRLFVIGTVDEPRDAGSDNRTRTHGARFQCDNESALLEPPAADLCRRVAQSRDFCMPRRILRGFARVTPTTDDLSVAIEDDGAHGNVTGSERGACLIECSAHRLQVAGRGFHTAILTYQA